MKQKNNLANSLRKEFCAQGVVSNVKRELKREVLKALNGQSPCIPTSSPHLVAQDPTETGIQPLVAKRITSPKFKNEALQNASELGVLQARKDLDRELKEIEEKYKSPLRQHTLSQSAADTKMFEFQRECEERERKRAEAQIEEFKRSFTNSVEFTLKQRHLAEMEDCRRATKIECDEKLEALRKQFREREKETLNQQREQREHLTKKIEELKKSTMDKKGLYDIEWRKLQLEEQRVKHILMTAEAKLQNAEKNEKNSRASTAEEFNRVRLAAKESYEDASESAKKQSIFYAKELESLNALRREMMGRINKSEAAVIEASKLRMENESLVQDIQREQAKTAQIQVLATEREARAQNDLALAQKQLIELQWNVDEIKEQLMEETNKYKDSENERLKLERKVESLSCQKERVKVEKKLLSEQVHNLQQLLVKSEGILENINDDKPDATYFTDGGIEHGSLVLQQLKSKQTEFEGNAVEIQRFREITSNAANSMNINNNAKQPNILAFSSWGNGDNTKNGKSVTAKSNDNFFLQNSVHLSLGEDVRSNSHRESERNLKVRGNSKDNWKLKIDTEHDVTTDIRQAKSRSATSGCTINIRPPEVITIPSISSISFSGNGYEILEKETTKKEDTRRNELDADLTQTTKEKNSQSSKTSMSHRSKNFTEEEKTPTTKQKNDRNTLSQKGEGVNDEEYDDYASCNFEVDSE